MTLCINFGVKNFLVDKALYMYLPERVNFIDDMISFLFFDIVHGGIP